MKNTVKSVIVLVLIFAVMMLGITGVNAYTAPIIAANGSAAVYEPLLEVMPDAQDFEMLYDAADPAASTLTDVPETVQGLYRETSGLGYVIRLSTTKGYTGEPIELTMAVDSEGKISGIKLNAFPDSKHLGEDYPDSYLGQDSALGGVSLVAGVTYSSKAFKEADILGDAKIVASGKESNFSQIPDLSDLPSREDASYVYICQNETVHGNRIWQLPNTKGHVLVADQSSMFLSEPVDVSQFGLIHAGVQKNVGPAGVQIVIVREDLIPDDLPGVPTMLRYKTHADKDSLYNTPPCYNIYICSLVFKWIKSLGGLEAMKERNERKAKVLYDFLDSSELFKGTVAPKDRSIMNVPFVTGDDEMDKKFIAEATAHGFVNIKGHRSVGGMRASIYNAMPPEGVDKLVEFMADFEKANK